MAEPRSHPEPHDGATPRRRRRGLLVRFLLILTPLFLLLAVPGVGALVFYTLHEDEAVLTVRFGNAAGRVAASLARYDPVADRKIVQDLLSSMAPDRALICAELVRRSDGARLVSQPPRIGCTGRDDGQSLELPVGFDGVYALGFRFSDAEVRQANNLQVIVALGVIGIAFIVAVLTSAVGFQYIVNRPLRLLLQAIEHTAATGERTTVDVRTDDELGTVIAAFNDLQERDIARKRALDAAHDRLSDSQEELTQVNRSLEARVRERTAELEEQIIEAEAANRAKSEFLANMSHELRTPLNAVIGFSEVIIQDESGRLGIDKYREYAADIHSSGVHLLEVINDILDIAKIEAGKHELYEQQVDLKQIVAACVRLMQERAGSGGVELQVEANDGTDNIVLWADMRACKQMLINLLSNAVKFTEAGGRVTVGRRVGPSGDLLLTVADTGIGIAPENIRKVVEPFFQIDGSLARKYEGTGLGLPLVKAFAEMHAGSVDIESELGAGTIVTIRLPAKRLLGPADADKRRAAG